MGHWLRANLQPPSGGRGHCRGHLPVPDCLGGADWRGETPSGVAVFCILLKNQDFYLHQVTFSLIIDYISMVATNLISLGNSLPRSHP